MTMDNTVVTYDQGTYYAATSVDGTYGYVYAGPEEPNEYDQHPNLIASDGLSFHPPGRQTANFPCVYYTPGYGYLQSSYNPYNPYIPGTVLGPVTRFMGTQHMQTVPQLNYTPVLYQPRSDSITTGYPNALYFNNGVGYPPSLLPMNESAAPSKVPSDNLSCGSSQPANNGLLNEGVRPRFEYNQNMGPRTNRPKNRLKPPIFLKAFMANGRNGNADGCIVLNPNEYNRPDFYVDYPRAKFFVIKSYGEDDVHKSIKYSVWSSTINGNEKLDKAYQEAQRFSVGKRKKCPVFLFFSVNGSGNFCGVAEMVGPVDFHRDMDFWLQDKWSGCFPVKWHIIKDVPNSSFRHIILRNNECRPVTSSRDTQEVPYLPGMNMLTMFKSTRLKTCILDDFSYYEERQRMIHEEKSMIELIYETSTDDSKIEEISVFSATDLANGKGDGYIQSAGENNIGSNEPLEFISNVELSKEIEVSDQSALSEETKQFYEGDVEDNSSDFSVEEELGKKKVDVKRGYVRKDVKEYKEAELTAQTTADSEDSNILTVGSMQINLADANRLISGILIIG